jgi:hypothetical protein
MKLNKSAILIAASIVPSMLLGGVVTYLLAAPTAPAAVKPDEEKAAEEKDKEAEADDEFVEVDLDSFNFTNNRVNPGSVVHISFKVVALVAKPQEIKFRDLATKTNKSRVRQVVERIVRSSELDDLNDPNLSTIKRLLREDINKVLARSFISEIVIHDYRLMEQ